MKIWMAMPKDWATQRSNPHAYISRGAMCPLRTQEMVQDNVYWFEADVLREMDVATENRDDVWRRQSAWEWRT